MRNFEQKLLVASKMLTGACDKLVQMRKLVNGRKSKRKKGHILKF